MLFSTISITMLRHELRKIALLAGLEYLLMSDVLPTYPPIVKYYPKTGDTEVTWRDPSCAWEQTYLGERRRLHDIIRQMPPKVTLVLIAVGFGGHCETIILNMCMNLAMN